MSCIRFNTPAQRAQLKAMAPAMLTREQAETLHPAPDFGPTKIARLRLLAKDPNPKIREAVALSLHVPADLQRNLAVDPDEGVRGCVARNETTECDTLRLLADDGSERVRGFLALNFYVPADVMERLAEDRSKIVRGLAAWKAGLAGVQGVSSP